MTESYAFFDNESQLSAWPWARTTIGLSLPVVPDDENRVFWPAPDPEIVPPGACDFLSLRRTTVRATWVVPAEFRQPTAEITFERTIEAGTRLYRDDIFERAETVLGTPVPNPKGMIDSRGLGWWPFTPGLLFLSNGPLFSAHYVQEWVEEEATDDPDEPIIHRYILSCFLAWGEPVIATKGDPETVVGWTIPVSPVSARGEYRSSEGPVSLTGGVTSYLLKNYLDNDGYVDEKQIGTEHADLAVEIEIPTTGGRW